MIMHTQSDTKKLVGAAVNLAGAIVEIITSQVKETIDARAAGPAGGSLFGATATPAEGWVMKKEAAKHCNISLRTLQNWMEKGLIPYIRLGPRNIRFKLSAVDLALKRRFQRNGL